MRQPLQQRLHRHGLGDWDTLAAAGGSSPYDFGFNHEGFATGGLGYLEATLAKLKARGIRALVDMHALPGGSSSCQARRPGGQRGGGMVGPSRMRSLIAPLPAPPLQSYAGWQVNQPLFWTGTPPATNATPIDAACGGAGPYYSSRGSAQTWLQVGEDMVAALGAWVVSLQANASLADVVVGLEVGGRA